MANPLHQPTGIFWNDPGEDILTAPALRSLASDFESEMEHRRWMLCRGDAYDLSPLLPSDSLDLIVTSPPYWGHRSYGQDHNWDILQDWRAEGGSLDEPPSYDWYRSHGGILGLEPAPQWFVTHLVEIFDRSRHALRQQGSLWVNLGDTYFARWSSIREDGRQGLGDPQRQRRRTPMGDYRQEKQLLMIPARFAIAMQDRKWILRNDLIWHKPNVPPRPERDRLRLSHEHFFHFVKKPVEGRAKYYYDLKAAEPGMNDVIVCNARPGEEGHSATFPEGLITPRIASSSPPGGVVLDPFCGSGRALSAAIKLQRKAIGFDVVQDFLLTGRSLLLQQRIVYE